MNDLVVDRHAEMPGRRIPYADCMVAEFEVAADDGTAAREQFLFG
jgi:hypothetical protein